LFRNCCSCGDVDNSSAGDGYCLGTAVAVKMLITALLVNGYCLGTAVAVEMLITALLVNGYCLGTAVAVEMLITALLVMVIV
jgi:hypothetical protein